MNLFDDGFCLTEDAQKVISQFSKMIDQLFKEGYSFQELSYLLNTSMSYLKHTVNHDMSTGDIQINVPEYTDTQGNVRNSKTYSLNREFILKVNDILINESYSSAIKYLREILSLDFDDAMHLVDCEDMMKNMNANKD